MWPKYLWNMLISHLFSSSGEINPFDLRMIWEDLVEILSRGVTQITGELQQAASLIIQGFLGKQEPYIINTVTSENLFFAFPHENSPALLLQLVSACPPCHWNAHLPIITFNISLLCRTGVVRYLFALAFDSTRLCFLSATFLEKYSSLQTDVKG